MAGVTHDLASAVILKLLRLSLRLAEAPCSLRLWVFRTLSPFPLSPLNHNRVTLLCFAALLLLSQIAFFCSFRSVSQVGSSPIGASSACVVVRSSRFVCRLGVVFGTEGSYLVRVIRVLIFVWFRSDVVFWFRVLLAGLGASVFLEHVEVLQNASDSVF